LPCAAIPNRDASPVTLRPAETADWNSVADIWHAGASLPGVGPDALPTRDALRAEIDKRLADGWVVTVAERRGTVVGFLAILPDQRVLAELFVAPVAIGSGIGTQLFRHAEGQMPQGFTLSTRPTNTRACRFYEQQGLRVVRRATHPRFGDAIVFYGTAA